MEINNFGSATPVFNFHFPYPATPRFFVAFVNKKNLLDVDDGLPSPELSEAQTTPRNMRDRLVARDTSRKLLLARAAAAPTYQSKNK